MQKRRLYIFIVTALVAVALLKVGGTFVYGLIADRPEEGMLTGSTWIEGKVDESKQNPRNFEDSNNRGPRYDGAFYDKFKKTFGRNTPDSTASSIVLWFVIGTALILTFLLLRRIRKWWAARKRGTPRTFETIPRRMRLETETVAADLEKSNGRPETEFGRLLVTLNDTLPHDDKKRSDETVSSWFERIQLNVPTHPYTDVRYGERSIDAISAEAFCLALESTIQQRKGDNES